ncbi:MAG: YcaQ family DNA glycosylase [Spirochaetaceae bacterium]|nr:YcaQ family DNA glycosylase [Spirochaetaceae bacterium]
MTTISNETARNFLVNYQNLNGYGELVGRDGAARYMQKVRCVQFDPLNVVGRNPDLVMQSRIKDYKPEVLFDLLYKERALYDAADKMISIVPTEDYPAMARIRQKTVEQLKDILTWRKSLGALELLDEIKEFIRVNGAQPATKINIGENVDSGKWGHKKLSSAALDYLYHCGELGISTKLKTHKVYDLSENLFPPEILKAKEPFKTERDFAKWYIKRRIGAVGMLWNKNGGAWLGFYVSDTKLRTEIIRELVDEGELLEFQVEGSKESFFIRKEDSSLLGKPAENNVAQFIAPLDNLIWDRGMIEELFDFKYTWEVYTPVAKRKYGYYVLPVLYKNQFVARFEPEPCKGKAPLQIKNWWWEPDVVVTDEMNAAIKDAFERFGKYLGVEVSKDALKTVKIKRKK